MSKVPMKSTKTSCNDKMFDNSKGLWVDLPSQGGEDSGWGRKQNGGESVEWAAGCKNILFYFFFKELLLRTGASEGEA